MEEKQKQEMSNALSSLNVAEVMPYGGLTDIAAAGDLIFQCGMFGVSNPAAGFAMVSICHQERMSFLEFSRRYHVDNRGKVTMRADRMLAEYHSRGGIVQWTEFNAKRAAGLWTYKHNVELEIDFTYEEAKEAGYIKDGSNWTKDPGAQLRARLITRAVRMLCPEAVAGVYDPDEMQDVYNSQSARNAPPADVDIEEKKPIVTIEVDNDDLATCPVQDCDFTGKLWVDLPSDILRTAKTLTHLGVTPEHITEIDKVLADRGEA